MDISDMLPFQPLQEQDTLEAQAKVVVEGTSPSYLTRYQVRR